MRTGAEVEETRRKGGGWTTVGRWPKPAGTRGQRQARQGEGASGRGTDLVGNSGEPPGACEQQRAVNVGWRRAEGQSPGVREPRAHRQERSGGGDVTREADSRRPEPVSGFTQREWRGELRSWSPGRSGRGQGEYGLCNRLKKVQCFRSGVSWGSNGSSRVSQSGSGCPQKLVSK